MKYFLIAGEASGDLHGAKLMKSLKQQDQEADFCFFGGELMIREGGKLLKHYREMAFMGAIDVIRNVGKINANFNLCRRHLLEFRPDVLILIDYPGFNLNMAQFACQHGIPVFYYILPKVWAWKEWRVKALKTYVDERFSIFPFEVPFFKKHGVDVHYIGNPLLDSLAAEKSSLGSRTDFLCRHHLPDKPLVALLPGSRAQEIRMMLPVMSRLAKDFPEFSFVISGTRAVEESLYSKFNGDPSVPVVFGETYPNLYHAHAAVVTSGTATLETALINTPQVVLYKMAGGKAGYRIFRYLFLKVKYVSLPNLVLDRGFLEEFVMDRMKYELVKPEVRKLLTDEIYRKAIFDSYRELRLKIGEEGASERAARLMVSLLHAKRTNR